MNSCAVCSAPSTKRCTACLGVYYCSKEHQKHDWKNHKASTCLPYKIKEDVSLGRHLVAARQLAAGELVVKENPSSSGTSTVSSLKQSCIANCFKVAESTGEIIVRAAQPIKPGEQLSLCYINPLVGTRIRLQFLRGFNSTCNCTRCLDPTEMGTHFSSLKCQKTGCNSLLVPPDNNLSSDMPWKCQICHEEISARNVIKLISSVRAAILTMNKKNFAECQDFINRFEPYLHENHFLLTEVRLAATNVPEAATHIPDSSNFTEDDWRVKLRYCRQLDQLLSKIARASYKIRCYTLLRMGASLIQLKGVENNEDAKQVAEKAFELLIHFPSLPSIFQCAQQMLGERGFPMPAAGH